MQGIRRRIELIRFEALVGKSNLEWLITLLRIVLVGCSDSAQEILLTSGTCPFSAWADAASVVTERLARGTNAFCLNFKVRLHLAARMSMM